LDSRLIFTAVPGVVVALSAMATGTVVATTVIFTVAEAVPPLALRMV
jgi:hypothetical protein